MWQVLSQSYNLICDLKSCGEEALWDWAYSLHFVNNGTGRLSNVTKGFPGGAVVMNQPVNAGDTS